VSGATVPVQLSAVVGGVVRTWTEAGETRLWRVGAASDEVALRRAQHHGVLDRVERAKGQVREVVELDPDASSLRLPGGTEIGLEPAEGVSPRASAREEWPGAINQAVRHVAESFEFLLIERGGWEAPVEPYALFALHVDDDGAQLSSLECSPGNRSSRLWAPHMVPGHEDVTVRAPVSRAAIDNAPFYLADAVAGWGTLPWDVTFTFGLRRR
jgi:hypothetical protein